MTIRSSPSIFSLFLICSFFIELQESPERPGHDLPGLAPQGHSVVEHDVLNVHLVDITSLVAKQCCRRTTRSDSEVPRRQSVSCGVSLTSRQGVIISNRPQEPDCDCNLVLGPIELPSKPYPIASIHGRHRDRRGNITGPVSRHEPRCVQNE